MNEENDNILALINNGMNLSSTDPTDAETCGLNQATQLKKTLDMDALFGHCTPELFCANFKGDIVITASSTYSKGMGIKIKNYLIENQPSKLLPGFRLGVSATKFGSLDIHILFKNIRSENECQVNVFNALSGYIDSEGLNLASSYFHERSINNGISKIEGNLVNKDALKVLAHLATEFERDEPVIYFETMGNKRSTISGEMTLRDIFERIGATFTRELFRAIQIDIYF